MAVDVLRHRHVATVTLDAAAGLNVLARDQLGLLLDALRGLREDPSVRCLILTGAGTKAFAAGADIREMADLTEPEGLAYARLGHAVANALEGFPRPTIAAINGYALGGGSELALACDIRLATEEAQIAQPEVMLGIPPGWGGTQRLTRLIGPGFAAELIYTGRRVKAGEALRLGIFNAVYPADRLMEEATLLAEQIAANSPSAVSAAKRAMALAVAGQPDAGLATEAALFAAQFGTAEQREGMTAFLEKRKPVFTGAEPDPKAIR